MVVLPHANIKTFRQSGLEHQTLASLADGTYTLEVWRQTLAVGAMTPWYRYACEEVIVVLDGRGECRMPGCRRAFGPESTLIMTSEVLHQLANTGDEPLQWLAILGMTPVTVRDTAGHLLALPWDGPWWPRDAPLD